MSNRTCPICSAEVGGSSRRVYCSTKCKGRGIYLQRKAEGYFGEPKLTSKACEQCSTVYESSNPRSRWCSEKCNSRNKHERRKAAGYYKTAEVRERQREYQRRKYQKDIELGLESGAAFARWEVTGRGAEARCTESACDRPLYAKLLCKPHYNRAYGNDLSGDDYRKRAEFYGVPFESFSRLSVFNRDGWMCGICHDPVDRHLAYPDPLSVSLDHVIPLSKGGGHLLSNVQCSHLGCNVRKGARDERRKIVSVS